MLEASVALITNTQIPIYVTPKYWFIFSKLFFLTLKYNQQYALNHSRKKILLILITNNYSDKINTEKIDEAHKNVPN